MPASSSLTPVTLSKEMITNAVARINHTTYELSYRKEYVDGKNKVIAFFNKIWLATFGHFGWCPGNRTHGVGTLTAQRVAIANYQSDRSQLISALSKADFIRQSDFETDPSTVPDNPVDQSAITEARRKVVDSKIEAFYKSSRKLTHLIAKNPDEYVALTHAVFQDLKNEIAKHNLYDKHRSPDKSRYIELERAHAIVKRDYEAHDRSILIKDDLTPSYIFDMGASWLDSCAQTHLKMFGNNTPSNRRRFILDLRKDVFKQHGQDFQEMQKSLDVDLSDDLYDCLPEYDDLPEFAETFIENTRYRLNILSLQPARQKAANLENCLTCLVDQYQQEARAYGVAEQMEQQQNTEQQSISRPTRLNTEVDVSTTIANELARRLENMSVIQKKIDQSQAEFRTAKGEIARIENQLNAFESSIPEMIQKKREDLAFFASKNVDTRAFLNAIDPNLNAIASKDDSLDRSKHSRRDRTAASSARERDPSRFNQPHKNPRSAMVPYEVFDDGQGEGFIAQYQQTTQLFAPRSRDASISPTLESQLEGQDISLGNCNQNDILTADKAVSVDGDGLSF